MASRIEVGDRVYQRRYDPCDVNVSVVVGSDGLLVADTRCSLAEARELRDHLRELSAEPVRWVVNTHIHWDHVWGNAEFVSPRQVPPAEVWGSAAPAENLIHPVHAACWYSWRMPPSRLRRRMSRRDIRSGSVIGTGSGYSGRALAMP